MDPLITQNVNNADPGIQKKPIVRHFGEIAANVHRMQSSKVGGKKPFQPVATQPKKTDDQSSNQTQMGYTVQQKFESKRAQEFQIFSVNQGSSVINRFDEFNQVFQDSPNQSIENSLYSCDQEHPDVSMETDHDDVEMIVEDDEHSSTVADPKLNHDEIPDFCTSTQYGDEIKTHMLQQEAAYQANPNYMRRQEDLTDNMRVILVDWLAEVSGEYNITEQTHHLAVNYTDRFLSKIRVKRAKLQLVGVTALYIAAKLEEIYPPDLNEFVYVTDDTYTKSQVLKMEQLMMKTLDFRLQPPTSIEFLHIFYYELNNFNKKFPKFLNMCMFLCELMTCHSKMIGQLNSRKAVAAMLYSLLTLRDEIANISQWRDLIVQVSGIAFDESMKTLLQQLTACHQDMASSEQKTVMDKYNDHKYDYVGENDPVTEYNFAQ